MTHYRIRDWNTHYEINRTRELKRMEWVPVPNRMDSAGYTALVDHPDAAAHFGAWIAIVEIASRQKVRGTFPHPAAEIPQALARISRLPAGLFEEVIPRLLSIGWIEYFQLDIEIPHLPAEKSHDGAEIPHFPAVSRAREHGREGKGIEGNGTAAFLSGAEEPPTKLTHEENQTLDLLIAYPGVQALPGKPDAVIVGKCLKLTGGNVDELALAFRALFLSGKKPSLSWAWFPKVLPQYLENGRGRL